MLSSRIFFSLFLLCKRVHFLCFDQATCFSFARAPNSVQMPARAVSKRSRGGPDLGSVRAAAPSRRGSSRPSRQTSRRGSAANASNDGGRVIVSIAEGRAMDVGVAWVSLDEKGYVYMSKVSDSHSFSQTLSLLRLMNPSEILLSDVRHVSPAGMPLTPDSFASSRPNLLLVGVYFYVSLQGGELSSKIRAIFEPEGTRVIDVARRFFNDTSGWNILKRIANNCLEHNVRSMYLPLAAFSALVQYTESYASFEYQSKSVKVITQLADGLWRVTVVIAWRVTVVIAWRNIHTATHLLTCSISVSGGMAIDYVTVKNLELIRNLQTGSTKSGSLFALMNHTATAVGTRLLKAQILKPPADEATINMRLNAVESLLDSEETFFEAVDLLSRLTNLDSLINTLVAQPKAFSPVVTKSTIRTIISLQHVLGVVSKLGKCVQKFKRSGNSNLCVLSLVLVLVSFLLQFPGILANPICVWQSYSSHWRKYSTKVKCLSEYCQN